MVLSGNRIRFNGGYALQATHTADLRLTRNTWTGNGTFAGHIPTKGQVLVDGKTSY